MQFLEVISPGWVGSLIGLIGLIGLIATFFLYRASRIGPRPVYQYRAFRLIGREEQALPEEVTILYQDKKVERLTRAHIILWNSGKTTLNGESIVADDPLRLEFSGDGEVLSANIVAFTRRSNKFMAKINLNSTNEVICTFDYLDAGDGAVIELLHTDEKRYPKVQGTIRGVPKGILDWGRVIPSRTQKDVPFPFPNQKIMNIIVLTSGILLIAIGVLGPILPAPFTLKPGGARWTFLAMGLLYFFTASFLLWVRRRRFPKSLTIEDIE